MRAWINVLGFTWKTLLAHNLSILFFVLNFLGKNGQIANTQQMTLNLLSFHLSVRLLHCVNTPCRNKVANYRKCVERSNRGFDLVFSEKKIIISCYTQQLMTPNNFSRKISVIWMRQTTFLIFFFCPVKSATNQWFQTTLCFVLRGAIPFLIRG